MAGRFFWWRKPEYPQKITDLSEVTDKFFSKQFEVLQNYNAKCMPIIDGLVITLYVHFI
jgi:hypothetical protein